MKIDLSPQAGFPLAFDPVSMAVDMAGARFEREARRAAQMRGVLLDPEAAPSDAELYWMYKLVDAGRDRATFTNAGLTFSCVLLPPLRIGREYVKTQGHYHPPMPGTSIEYPEVYTHYFGRLYLLIQRRQNGQASRLDDCVLIDMRPGHSILVPPGYAHVLINPSDRPALMGGLYSPDFQPDYEPVRQSVGAGHYLIDEAGHERVLPNAHYESLPPLRRLTDLAGTRFAPPDDRRPLWASFVQSPHLYAFLSDPHAARRRFAAEGSKA